MNTADLAFRGQSGTTMVRRRCDIELPSGPKLEAVWTKPVFQPDEERAVKLAVCLHPWSRLGGNMRDPVLESLLDTLTVMHRFCVLRYNSRGVGESSGSASFTGFAEAEDLQEVVQVAIQELGNVKEVLILGYSHGSLVASLHPILPPPTRTMHVLLSYPLDPRGFLTLFNSRTYQNRLEALLRDSRAHVLVVHGDADNFTGAAAYDQWANELADVAAKKAAEGHASPKASLPQYLRKPMLHSVAAAKQTHLQALRAQWSTRWKEDAACDTVGTMP